MNEHDSPDRPLVFRPSSRDDALHRFPWMDLARATGGETICGNTIELHFDGPTTFASGIESIESAEKFVYFENYLVRDDATGRRFRDALMRKARAGVPVHVIYDWFGCWATPRGFWMSCPDTIPGIRPPSRRTPSTMARRSKRVWKGS